MRLGASILLALAVVVIGTHAKCPVTDTLHCDGGLRFLSRNQANDTDPLYPHPPSPQLKAGLAALSNLPTMSKGESSESRGLGISSCAPPHKSPCISILNPTEDLL